MAPCRRKLHGALRLRVVLLFTVGAWSLRCCTFVPGSSGRQEASNFLRRRLFFSTLVGTGLAPVEVRAEVPTLKVAGSSKPMPAIGYGTCCRPGARGEELVEGVKAYLAAGGRLIDTAQIYGNHEDIAEAIQQSGVDREQLWVTSKVRVQSCNTPEDVLKAVDNSLQQLNIGYLDLMLLHGGDGWGISPDRDEALWQGLIAAQKAGRVRSIGVSNHNREEVERLITKTKVTPAVNQLEFHPWVPAETRDLVRWCQDKGIVVTAYGSLGGSRNKAQGEVVSKVASQYGKTNAQVLLRWALDQGVAVIPGTNSEEHIREDLDLNFRLEPRDVQLIESSLPPQYFTRWRNCRSGCA